jgi:hypothetical protein
MSEYTDAFELNMKDVEAPSVGACPGCETCWEHFGPDAETIEEFDEMYERGEVCDEASFSWHGCACCGTSLGGDRHVWHYIWDDEIVHDDDCCTDCALFMSNGDEPEDWRRR